MEKTHHTPTKGESILIALDQADSFAFEMKILRMLGIGEKKILFKTECWHGGLYTDPITGKNRQFDIRSIVTNGNRQLLIAVEAKLIHESNPIVGSRIPRHPSEAFHDVMLTGPQTEQRTRDEQGRIYRKGDFVAKTIACPVLRQGKIKSEMFAKEGHIYDKYTQALNSVEEMLNAKLEQEKTEGMQTIVQRQMAFAAIPILVVPNDCLWVIDYNELGDRTSDPRPTEEFTLYLGRKVAKPAQAAPFVISHQHFVTVDGFKDLLDRIKGDRPEMFGALFDWLNWGQ